MRECIVDIVRHLFDVNDPRFMTFANSNGIIESLSKSLMVRHNVHGGHDGISAPRMTLKFTVEISARVDMKILQIIAVNFEGRDILYHSVFERIKECVMSPQQDMEFVLYALNVIRTILEDAQDDARRWIGADCANEQYQMEHTIQFAVYVMETYSGSDAEELARGILHALK